MRCGRASCRTAALTRTPSVHTHCIGRRSGFAGRAHIDEDLGLIRKRQLARDEMEALEQSCGQPPLQPELDADAAGQPAAQKQGALSKAELIQRICDDPQLESHIQEIVERQVQVKLQALINSFAQSASAAAAAAGSSAPAAPAVRTPAPLVPPSTASNSSPGFPTFSASEGGRYVPDPQQLPPDAPPFAPQVTAEAREAAAQLASKSTDTDEESVEEVD